jgi:hypothetical protein
MHGSQLLWNLFNILAFKFSGDDEYSTEGFTSFKQQRKEINEFHNYNFFVRVVVLALSLKMILCFF